MIFQGVQTSIAKKHFIFVILPGGGGGGGRGQDPLFPPLDPHMNCFPEYRTHSLFTAPEITMECGDVFNSSVGWISSLDRDGDGLYDSNEDCMWIIKAPDFFGIQLTIIYLEIESNVLCSYDYLKVVK